MKLSQYKSVRDTKEEPLDEDEDLPPLLQVRGWKWDDVVMVTDEMIDM